MKKGFTVIMPTYNQATFIRRSIQSLFNQTLKEWELIIINDGVTDNTEQYIEDFLTDVRITYIKNEKNEGIGLSINKGLDLAQYTYIAYLPSDDYFYENHLQILYDELEKDSNIVLTYTKVKSEIKDSFSWVNKPIINGLFENVSLQLVQTAHHNTSERWITRKEWVCEDFFDLFWRKLTTKGIFTYIDRETACWTIHAHQHHRLVSEKNGGGLNYYRGYYNIKEPIRIKASKYKFIDEVEMYKDFHQSFKYKEGESLRILIIGDLWYNPERIYALEKAGHQLYGLWLTKPTYSFAAIGHLPFGNIIDIPFDNWENEVHKIKPDIIYATVNFGAVNLAYEIFRKASHVPFVWHFKEGPFVCREKGLWEKLINLYNDADGKIYLNKELKEWYEQFIHKKDLSFIMDGDLPNNEYFTDNFSSKLSSFDGAIHTLVPGRIIGITPTDMTQLANNSIHLHSYTENYHAFKDSFNREMKKAAPNHFHVHKHCSPKEWVSEFSKYDAGWLHCFDSNNNGKLQNASWNDLNMAARMNTLAAAGIPMIQKNNNSHIVAMQSYLKEMGVGVFFVDYDDLANQLKDKKKMGQLSDNVIKWRNCFTLDYHIPALTTFFRQVIESKKQKQSNY